VAYAYNASYSGGRDQEDCSPKSAGEIVLRDPISKICITKGAGGVAQGEGPEFKPQYHKKKKKKQYLLLTELVQSVIRTLSNFLYPTGKTP
jgi:hypothetical protein